MRKLKLQVQTMFGNPTAIGTGLPVFRGTTRLDLVAATGFECGVTELHYRPKSA